MERRLRVTDEWAYKGFDKKQEVLLMNMKKLTALFCAFAMTFSLTACRRSKGDIGCGSGTGKQQGG